MSGSTAGIGFAVARQPAALDLSRTMSAFGTKRTSAPSQLQCLLMTQSGHRSSNCAARVYSQVSPSANSLLLGIVVVANDSKSH